MGSNSTFFVFVLLLSRGLLLMNIICSIRGKFFSIRVDPTLKGSCYPGMQIGSHKQFILKILQKKKAAVYPRSLT